MVERKTISDRVRLSDGYISKLNKLDKRYFIKDSEVPGLWLKVETSGAKAFVYSYRPKGKTPRRIFLGTIQVLTVAKARRRVKELQKEIFDGKDPIEKRDQYKQELTLGESLKNWMDNSLTVSNSYRRSTIKAIKNTFKVWIYKQSNQPSVRSRYVGLPELKNKKISAITKEDIKKLHKQIGGDSPIQANRIVAYLKIFFNSILKEGQVNPCRIKKRDLYEEVEYKEYLSDTEFGRVLDFAFKKDDRSGRLLKSHYKEHKLNPVSCCLIAFQLCTGRRTRNEASNLMWSMVRDDRIVLSQTKTSKHKTPTTFYLSDAAKDILTVIKKERLVKYEPGPDGKDWFRNRFSFDLSDLRTKYVFPSRDFGRKIAGGLICKKPYQEDVRATWKKLLSLCGVDRHLKHYATRHTLATYILNNGGNINQVMKVLGVSMNTAMTYAKLVPGSELQILNKIGEKKQKLPLVQVK
jgi:integrase